MKSPLQMMQGTAINYRSHLKTIVPQMRSRCFLEVTYNNCKIFSSVHISFGKIEISSLCFLIIRIGSMLLLQNITYFNKLFYISQ